MSEQKKIWLVYADREEDPLWACENEADAQEHAEDEREKRGVMVWVDPMPISGPPS